MYAKKIQMSSFTKVEIQIAKFIFRHYKERYNARQLAKILDINHANANKLCKELVKKKLLKKEDIGNSIYYKFDYKNDMAINFMKYLISIEDQYLPEWLGVLDYNLKKFCKYIRFGCIFGSSIKSKGFNDIDILLVYDKRNTNEVKRIKEEIRKSELIGKPIRYVEISEKDIIINQEDKIFYSMLSENIVFCNPERYVEAIKNVSDK